MKHTSNLSTHTQRGPRCGGPRGPPEWPNQAPLRAGSASLESSHPPRAGSASLESSHPPRAEPPPLEWVPPRSRAHAPLERVSPHSRLPHERTCSHTWVRAFDALTQQSRTITRLEITPRRYSANSLGEAHPRHCGGLCDEAGVSSVTLCRPLLYG
jgi:hypothetical protein